MVRSYRRATIVEISEKVNAGSDRKEAWSDQSCFLLHYVEARLMCVSHTGKTWHQDTLCEEGEDSVMSWAMFCRKTLGPGIHVDTRTMGHEIKMAPKITFS